MIHFTAGAATRKGKNKSVNEDSLIVRHIEFSGNEVLMAIVCDGVGGLAQGELASSTVIRRFSDWFDHELIAELEHPDIDILADQWRLIIRRLNSVIVEYGTAKNEKLGTTCTGLLFINDKWLMVHVGDTRVYRFGEDIERMTVDQTFVEREIELGRLTPEEAKSDRHKNALLQCVGGSANLQPQITQGTVSSGAYLICSDGFRHKISESEMKAQIEQMQRGDKEEITMILEEMENTAVERKETDDISAILIRAERSPEDRL